MQMMKTEAKLLMAIRDGASTITGEDVHTLRALIRSGLATGADASDDGGLEFIEVSLTPAGREVATDLLIDE
ncbi:hypothetical protein PI739_02900 [Pseudomonas cerasi]|uniref:hypothetical protein n=1 Tax=Pseudomonas cerasi TaxID=1583341 RepID=UPI002301494D|nr:hypothetical protein [Pseudomonas cerasi]MDA7011299.1 hypothetical protein [Pseudomonas cerasi]